MSNRFDDVAETLERAAGEADVEDRLGDDGETPAAAGDADGPSGEGDRDEHPAVEGSGPTPEEPTEPGVAAGDVRSHSLAARSDTWEDLEESMAVAGLLLDRRGVDPASVEVRELHDAALRVAAEHPEELAAALLAARADGE
jgi:hypothetical protein